MSTLAEVAWRPPRIATARLQLRGYEPDDAPAIYRYASDPEVTRYVAFNPHQTEGDAVRFLNGVVGPNYARRYLDYAITLRQQPAQVVGGVGLYWRPRSQQILELGYILARAFWGHGYVPEAATALIAHAFATTRVHRVFAPIFAENERSRRAAEKMGLTYEGTLRSAFARGRRRWDLAIYSILRHEVQLPS